MRAAARVALCATMIAASTFAVTPTALAAASITVTGAQVMGAQYGRLWVWGTATCSTTSGTAVIRASGLQVLMHMASDGGTTTIPCSAQPAQWSVDMSPQVQCFQPFVDQRCFMTNSQVTVIAEVVENGVSQAFSMGPFPT